MIGRKTLATKKLDSISDFYQQTTEYYIAGKYPQTRSNILAMGKNQRKDFLFFVHEQYPNDVDFLKFIMNLI